jgi:hypothetical protein
MMATQQIDTEHKHHVFVHQWNLISRAIAEQLNNQPFFWDFANHVMFLFSPSLVVHCSLSVMKSKHKHNNWG